MGAADNAAPKTAENKIYELNKSYKKSDFAVFETLQKVSGKAVVLFGKLALPRERKTVVCNQRAGMVLLEIHPRLCKGFEHSVGLVYAQNVLLCIRYKSFGEVFIDERGHAAKLAPGKIFYLFYLCARCIVKGTRAD